MSIINRVVLARKGHGVTRCHASPHLRGTTVGHHSAGVAALVLAAYAPALPPSILLRACILHDLPEQYTGDLPAMVKWDNPELKNVLSRVERTWWANTPYKECPELPLSKDEHFIFKWADIMELTIDFLEQLDEGNKAARFDAMRCVRHLEHHFRPRFGDSEVHRNMRRIFTVITNEVKHHAKSK